MLSIDRSSNSIRTRWQLFIFRRPYLFFEPFYSTISNSQHS